MSNSKNLRDEIKEQHKKLNDMTFTEKKEYIWEYYKIHILISFIVIITATVTIISFVKNNYETVFTTVVADGKMTGFSDNTDLLTTEFSKYIGVDGKHKRVIFNNNFTLTQKQGDEDSYYSTQKIVTMATAHSIDGFLCEYNYVNFYSSGDDLFLTDLTELLTADELNRLSDFLVYYTKPDGTKIPIAVDLSTTKVKTETDLTMERPCYGVVSTSKHSDTAAQFIRYAFGL